MPTALLCVPHCLKALGQLLPAAIERSDPQASALFGRAGDYSWLRGKLDYSTPDRAWQLRYVAPGHPADSHGGSVRLSDARLLNGCERGDFLEIWGTLTPSATGDQAVYAIEQVKRLGP